VRAVTVLSVVVWWAVVAPATAAALAATIRAREIHGR